MSQASPRKPGRPRKAPPPPACPYCGQRPLGPWPGAVTCGQPECQEARQDQRAAEAKGSAPLCPFCNKRPLAQREDIPRGAETCGGLDCRIKRVKAWAAPPAGG